MNYEKLEELLEEQKVVVLDGALATELENRGLSLADSLWSAKILAEQPEEIEAVHYMTISARARISAFLPAIRPASPGF